MATNSYLCLFVTVSASFCSEDWDWPQLAMNAYWHLSLSRLPLNDFGWLFFIIGQSLFLFGVQDWDWLRMAMNGYWHLLFCIDFKWLKELFVSIHDCFVIFLCFRLRLASIGYEWLLARIIEQTGLKCLWLAICDCWWQFCVFFPYSWLRLASIGIEWLLASIIWQIGFKWLQITVSVYLWLFSASFALRTEIGSNFLGWAKGTNYWAGWLKMALITYFSLWMSVLHFFSVQGWDYLSSAMNVYWHL